MVLLKHGCKINSVNKHGETPLEKVLRLAKGTLDFHTKTRINLAKKLVGIGCKVYPKGNVALSKKKQTVGRDKVYDKYLEVLKQSGTVRSLQCIARTVVRESFTSGVAVKKQVDILDIPENLKSFILFADVIEL